MANEDVKNFRLKHTVSPLVVYVIIFLAVAYFGVHGAGIGIVIAVFVVLLGFTFVEFWHSVTYRDGIITGVLFPWRPVSIKLSDIATITQEIDMLRFETRRCIVIYGRQSQKPIKISLAVFLQDDLRKLMRIIHDARPDLVVPEIKRYWMGSKW